MHLAILVPLLSLLLLTIADPDAFPFPKAPGLDVADKCDTSHGANTTGAQFAKHLTPPRRCTICGQKCEMFHGQRCAVHFEMGDTCIQLDLDHPGHHHFPRAETTSVARARVGSELRSKHDEDVKLAKRLTPIRWCRICGMRCGVYLTTYVCPVHYKELGNTCVAANRLRSRRSLDAPTTPLHGISVSHANHKHGVGFQKRLEPKSRCRLCNRECTIVYGHSFRCRYHGRTYVAHGAVDPPKSTSLELSPSKDASHDHDHKDGTNDDHGVGLQKRSAPRRRCNICNRKCICVVGTFDVGMCPVHGITCTIVEGALDHTREPPALEAANHHLDHAQSANHEPTGPEGANHRPDRTEAAKLPSTSKDTLAKRLAPVPRCFVDGCGQVCIAHLYFVYCPQHFHLGPTCSREAR